MKLVILLSLPLLALASGSCPYSKENQSWGEYQVTIPMESSVNSASVVLTFDAETTIGSCHSGCTSEPKCTGSVCKVSYTGSSLQLFNVKKVDPSEENDRSNLVSVTIARVEQCETSPSCPYSKENLSWGEYQVTIPMESSVSSASVVLTFDAETTIGSCHSGCTSGPECAGSVCTVSYTGSSLQLFNVKKVDPSEENDRSNLISVTIAGVQQC